eukprot:10725373-Alexandrium_andersonii.AAC.1
MGAHARPAKEGHRAAQPSQPSERRVVRARQARRSGGCLQRPLRRGFAPSCVRKRWSCRGRGDLA